MRTWKVVVILNTIMLAPGCTGTPISPDVVPTASQGPVTLEFDVQPILQQHCVSCYGPSQQMSGLRLDRRREAMRGGTIGTVIAPGSPERSRLLVRISGNAMGPQLPPTGAMQPEQIAVLARWIQQGARWPDALSGEGPVVPPHPGATRLMDLLRAGDTSAFKKALAALGPREFGSQALRKPEQAVDALRPRP
jgi:hypothetical protein